MQILITKVDLQYSSWISILGRSIKLISELICYPLVPTCGGGAGPVFLSDMPDRTLRVYEPG